MKQAYFAEFIGTLFLTMGVIGSGIMAQKGAGGNEALALLCNALATAALLYVLITLFAPLSGAHFNPLVSYLMLDSLSLASGYALCQILGALIGIFLTHAMFDLPILQISTTIRSSRGLFLAEFVASFGLLLSIKFAVKQHLSVIPSLVALYILAAYFFTASTSFANPALTLARSLTQSFAGIAPQSLVAFIVAQLLGGVSAHYFVKKFLK